jgi:hypothetical protein
MKRFVSPLLALGIVLGTFLGGSTAPDADAAPPPRVVICHAVPRSDQYIAVRVTWRAVLAHLRHRNDYVSFTGACGEDTYDPEID